MVHLHWRNGTCVRTKAPGICTSVSLYSKPCSLHSLAAQVAAWGVWGKGWVPHCSAAPVPPPAELGSPSPDPKTAGHCSAGHTADKRLLEVSLSGFHLGLALWGFREGHKSAPFRQDSHLALAHRSCPGPPSAHIWSGEANCKCLVKRASADRQTVLHRVFYGTLPGTPLRCPYSRFTDQKMDLESWTFHSGLTAKPSPFPLKQAEAALESGTIDVTPDSTARGFFHLLFSVGKK